MEIVKSIKQLESLTGIRVPQKQKEQMQKILEKYPVRFTSYLLKLIKKSPAVAKQFVPSVDELITVGAHRPWTGKIDTGVFGLERMYTDRCIILPVNQCPAYCRHCVRKDYLARFRRAMTLEEIDKALDYIKKDKRIKEVLITGGDPLIDLKRLEYIIKGLRKISHIGPVRIGTRHLMNDPKRITNAFVRTLQKYHNFNNGKLVELSPQFNHPDELTKESIHACSKLVNAGIRLYSQSVLLKGVNDSPEILSKLFRRLRQIGVEIHYLYHCACIEGADHFRTTVQKGIEIKRNFRNGYLSGRANPAYIILTPVGKMEPLIDGEIMKQRGKFITIRTPYTIAQFKKLNSKFKLPGGCKTDKNGFIICEYIDGKD